MSLNHPKDDCPWSLLLCCVSLRLWPPANFLPILLHQVICFCHILLWLPCVIFFVPAFPLVFVFPTGSLRALTVICNWLDDMTCVCAPCLDWRRWWPPGDPGIGRAINIEPADNNRVVDRHVVWEVMFDGFPDYSEDFVWANGTMFLCCFIHAVCTVIAVWQNIKTPPLPPGEPARWQSSHLLPINPCDKGKSIKCTQLEREKETQRNKNRDETRARSPPVRTCLTLSFILLPWPLH